jgi:3-dehydroquinate synthase
VDYGRHKNLLGTYSYPELVLCSTCILQSLPLTGITDGMAEATKVAVVDGPDLFDSLECFSFSTFRDDVQYAAELVYRLAHAKLRQLQRGSRWRVGLHPLDLGHTFGHAIERLQARQLSHGMAVGIDLATSTRVALTRDLLSKEDGARILTLLERLHIAASLCNLDQQEVFMISENLIQIQQMRGTSGMVIPAGIGYTDVLDDVSLDELLLHSCPVLFIALI